VSEYVGLGFNWRMSSITASLGIAQISKLDKIIKMRQEHAKFISSQLEKIPEISVPNPPKGYEHIYQMYTIRLPNKTIRDALHQFLTKKRIFSKVYFHPIHLTDFYRKNPNYDSLSLPVTEQISNRVLTLPLYPNMTLEEKTYLISSIKEFFENS
jgi:perosamine synthetase